MLAIQFDEREQRETDRREVALKEADVQGVAMTIHDLNFWNTQTVEPEGEDMHDGGLWLMEGRKGWGYHVVYRWKGFQSPFRELYVMLLRLAGMAVPEQLANVIP